MEIVRNIILFTELAGAGIALAISLIVNVIQTIHVKKLEKELEEMRKSFAADNEESEVD